MPKTRWQAFSIHLGLCAVLYVVLLYLILFHWYPQPYFAADGGWQGIRLITGVDLVLGPLLTLIVFKPGKPGLRRDLTLIGILQTVAIIWGTWLVYKQRTAMVTYAYGSFYTLNPEQLQNAGGKAVEVAEQAETIPPYGFVRLPKDSRERTDFVLKTVLSGKLLQQLGDRYEPFGKSNFSEVLSHSLALDRFLTLENNQELVDRFLARHGGTLEDYAFLPLIGRYQEPLLALRRNDGKILDTLNIVRTLPPPEKSTEAVKPEPDNNK